ncbi:MULTISPECIES: AMP-binding protein [unclassified Variovorax]|uniref:AMP-binding protein n=1 Tax=unclassified Variovorax TaxID=663243 RepID=UPI003ECFDA8A
MQFPDLTLWRPDEGRIAGAALTALARRAGVQGYDALHRLSIERPADYWRHVLDHLAIEWFAPYDTFCVHAPDPAHPRWFVGGRINWVHNALRWARDPLHADRLALACESEDGRTDTLSYAALDLQVRRVAGGLRALGVGRGDRVGLMLPMGAQAVTAFLAVCALGAVCVPLFTGFGADAIASRLALAGASVLIAADAFGRRGRVVQAASAINEAARGLPLLAHVVVVPGGGLAIEGAFATRPWDDLAGGAPIADVEAMDPNDPFMIVFTSGTTGAPKGTVHVHGGFALKIAHDTAFHFEVGPGDVWYWPSDMGWIVGPITTVGTLTAGATLLCYDGAPDFPDWSRFAAMIERYRVTHFGASPTLIRSLAANEALSTRGDLRSLRLLMAAGEVLDPEHFEWFFRRMGAGVLPVINYTGGTEASGAILANVPVRPIKASGFNSASPGVHAFAADDAGRRIVGTPGELTIAAPFVGMTQGFWQADDRYMEAYWQAVPGCWTHGDLVQEDGEGHFFVLGRSDDTLKVAGKRLGPAEVESVVLAALPLRDAAAIGLPDATKGQKLVVLLQPQDGATAEAVASFGERAARAIEHALGKPFRPAAVHCVPDLPRTRNGKVMRRVIRRVLTGQPPGDLSSLANPEALAALRQLANAG